MDAFDKAQIGRFPMVFHDRIEARPEAGRWVTAKVKLDPIARSFVAYLEFSRPITDIDANVEMTAEFAGSTVKVRLSEPDGPTASASTPRARPAACSCGSTAWTSRTPR